MKNCSFQSGQMMVTYEDGIIKIVTDQNTVIYMSSDDFVDFFSLCGKMANRIIRHASSIGMVEWKPDMETAAGGE